MKKFTHTNPDHAKRHKALRAPLKALPKFPRIVDIIQPDGTLDRPDTYGIVDIVVRPDCPNNRPDVWVYRIAIHGGYEIRADLKARGYRFDGWERTWNIGVDAYSDVQRIAREMNIPLYTG